MQQENIYKLFVCQRVGFVMNFASMGLMHRLIYAKILSRKRGVIQLEMI